MIRLFRVSIPTSVLVLVISDTVIITACYVGAAFLALDPLNDPLFYIQHENGGLQILFAVAIVQVGFYLTDLYDDVSLRSRVLLIRQLFLLLGISFLAQALVGYSEWTLLQLPQWTMVYGSFFVLAAVPAWRLIFFSLIRKALPDTNILFVGMPESAQEITRTLAKRPDMGFAVTGYLDTLEEFKEAPYFGHPDELGEVLRKHPTNLVSVDHNRKDPGWLVGSRLFDLRASGVKVEQTANLYEVVLGRVSLRDLRPLEILADGPGLRRWTIRFQTLYSMLLALVGLLIFLPIMTLVFLLVKRTSPGPALYKQKRVGRNGSTFFLYKFRSMYIDAEVRSGPVWATSNDPRITPVGRWLRKFRLDELPQFFNVLRGEMSLVGPRPERPEFCALLEKEIPFYNQRHTVKPGITGWAQINHKYTENVEDTVTKVEYDLYYVKHLAPALDAYIIFHTLKVMLLTRGAQ